MYSAQLLERPIPFLEFWALDASGRLFQIKLYVNGAPMIYKTAPSHDPLRQLRAGIGELMEWADMRHTVSFMQHAFLV